MSPVSPAPQCGCPRCLQHPHVHVPGVPTVPSPPLWVSPVSPMALAPWRGSPRCPQRPSNSVPRPPAMVSLVSPAPRCACVSPPSVTLSLLSPGRAQEVQAENVTVLEGGTAEITCHLHQYDGSIVVIQNPARQTLFFNGTRGEGTGTPGDTGGDKGGHGDTSSAAHGGGSSSAAPAARTRGRGGDAGTGRGHRRGSKEVSGGSWGPRGGHSGPGVAMGWPLDGSVVATGSLGWPWSSRVAHWWPWGPWGGCRGPVVALWWPRSSGVALGSHGGPVVASRWPWRP